MAAGFISEWWPASNRNGGRLHVGKPGRNKSESAHSLSAPSMLQIFGLNPANADAEVMWQFGPLVSAGWASRESFQTGARRTQTILVATEGASDARIISRAHELLRPDVTDFFRFIDVNERHHFWGTGNLVKFAEGLHRIDVHSSQCVSWCDDIQAI